MTSDVLAQIEAVLNAEQVRYNPRKSEERIDYALAHYRTKNAGYKKYIDYYEGFHDLRFATEKWKNAFGGMFRQFADNLCPAIVDAAADRMQITGFDVPDDEDLSNQLWKLWTTSKMDSRAGSVHEHAFKVGDAYVIVWPDANNNVQISPNPAHQICVYYSDDGETVEWATKLWPLANKQYRLNLYTQDSIEKFVTTSTVRGGIPRSATAFRRFAVPGESWPIPNGTGRVPVFHFANKPEMGIWGQSELHDILPLQDALNKCVADMLVAMEFVALPQRWATGLEVDEDPVTHQPLVPFKAAVDRVWAVGDPDVRFGQFEQADLERFTRVQNDLRLEMARISRTPLHYLGMGAGAQSAFVASMYPSGESLKTAEAPFAAKVVDRQTTFGDRWEEIILFAAQFSDIEVPEEINTLWTPATPRSQVEDLDNAQKKQNIGIPQEVIWEELGYTKSQISAMSAARDAAAQKAVELAVASKPPVQTARSEPAPTRDE